MDEPNVNASAARHVEEAGDSGRIRYFSGCAAVLWQRGLSLALGSGTIRGFSMREGRAALPRPSLPQEVG